MEGTLTTRDIVVKTKRFPYLGYFGLRELPFRNIPDTDYYFCTESGRDVMNNLLFSMQGGEGLIKVTGEVGTGKTMLCHQFLNSLDDNFITVYCPIPYPDRNALTRAIRDDLRRAIESRRNLVLCFDEAQGMTSETLETIRLISNLEIENSSLIYIILVGQPELDVNLNQPSLRNLKQRIAFSCTLHPLVLDELAQYIGHRLRVSGYSGDFLFSAKALERLAKASQGVPRLINILAHKAMMAAFGEGDQTITGSHVKAAVRDTESVRPGSLFSQSTVALLCSGLRGIGT